MVNIEPGCTATGAQSPAGRRKGNIRRSIGEFESSLEHFSPARHCYLKRRSARPVSSHGISTLTWPASLIRLSKNGILGPLMTESLMFPSFGARNSAPMRVGHRPAQELYVFNAQENQPRLASEKSPARRPCRRLAQKSIASRSSLALMHVSNASFHYHG